MLEWLEQASLELRQSSRVFTEKNLYYASRRRSESVTTFAEFRDGPLAARLRQGALPGLLSPARPFDGARLPREYAAYFPQAILLVDRLTILDLFVASGVLATAKLAVVCLDGSPAPIVRWLARGFRAGRRAPVAYVHDATTVAYPFLVEPLATLVDAVQGEPFAYRDLGLPPMGLLPRAFLFADEMPQDEPVLELEALPPCALLAYATRRLLGMVPGDPNMAALRHANHEPRRSP